MVALYSNQAFAEELRQVFGLDFTTVLNGNPGMGKEWFRVTIRMMKEKSREDFQDFTRKWDIPQAAIKYYALEHLAGDVAEPERKMMMELAGIHDVEATAHREEKDRKNALNQGRGRTGQMLRAVIARPAEA